MSAPTNVTVIVNGTQATNRVGEVDPTSHMARDGAGISSSTTMAKSTMMFKWKAEDHSCTDVPCCVVFGLWWLAMIVVAGMAMNSGNPTSLLHGVDYTGNTCGSGRVRNKKMLPDRFADIMKDYGVETVDELFKESLFKGEGSSWADFFENRPDIVYPRTNIDKVIADTTTSLVPEFFGVCRRKCPLTGELTCTYRAQLLAHRACLLNKTKEEDPAKCLRKVYDHCAGSDDDARCELSEDRRAEFKENCWSSALNQQDIVYHCLESRHINVEVWCKDPLRNGKEWFVDEFGIILIV